MVCWSRLRSVFLGAGEITCISRDNRAKWSRATQRMTTQGKKSIGEGKIVFCEIAFASFASSSRTFKTEKVDRNLKLCISSVQSLSRVRLFATPWTAARQASLSITNSQSSLRLMSFSRWCHPAISSSVVPFSSCPQSLPASESFPVSQLFASGGQSTGVLALASFLPKKSQGWSLSEWTGWISLQSKGLSRVFSNTTVQKDQFFSAQPSSQSNSHIHTWPQEKP